MNVAPGKFSTNLCRSETIEDGWAMVLHLFRFSQCRMYIPLMIGVLLQISQVEANKVKYISAMAAGIATAVLPSLIVPGDSQRVLDMNTSGCLAAFGQFDEGRCFSFSKAPLNNASLNLVETSQSHAPGWGLKNVEFPLSWRSRKLQAEKVQHELVGDVNRLVVGKVCDQYTWKISDVDKLVKKAGKHSDFCVCTEPFYLSSGYKLHLCFYPNSFGKQGEYASFSYVIHKGEFDERLAWPFPYKMTALVLSQPIDHEQRLGAGKTDLYPIDDFSGNQKPVESMNDPSGFKELILLKELKNGSYLRGNKMYLQFMFYHPESALLEISDDLLKGAGTSADMGLD